MDAVELRLVSARTSADPLELDGFTTVANLLCLKSMPMLCRVRITPLLVLQPPIKLMVRTVTLCDVVGPRMPTTLSYTRLGSTFGR